MMIKINLAFLGLTAAAALTVVTAASLPRADPPTCASAVTTVLSSNSADPGINCVAPSALNNLIQQGATNKSLASVNASTTLWLTDMCGVGMCSPAVIEQVGGNISAGCGTDFAGFPLSSNVSALIDTLKSDYPIVRDMMCMKNNDQFCMTDLLTEAIVGGLNLADPVAVVGTLITRAFNLDCNNCTKAAFRLASLIAPSFYTGAQAISTVCGADFTTPVDGPEPASITHTAVSFMFSQNGGVALAPTAALLLAVTAVFITLM
ncbi:hypothetical protein FB451DRAFT_1095054 [Mycena latifolia]|nr:hypothetical protein FB451DRAFT_1095054 [Mycena latifolia]